MTIDPDALLAAFEVAIKTESLRSRLRECEGLEGDALEAQVAATIAWADKTLYI